MSRSALRAGEPIPEGIDPERVIFIERTFIAVPQRAEDELPALEPQAAPAVERPAMRQMLEYPPLGVV